MIKSGDFCTILAKDGLLTLVKKDFDQWCNNVSIGDEGILITYFEDYGSRICITGQKFSRIHSSDLTPYFSYCKLRYDGCLVQSASNSDLLWAIFWETCDILEAKKVVFIDSDSISTYIGNEFNGFWSRLSENRAGLVIRSGFYVKRESIGVKITTTSYMIVEDAPTEI